MRSAALSVCSTLQYSTVQYSTVQYSTVKYSVQREEWHGAASAPEQQSAISGASVHTCCMCTNHYYCCAAFNAQVSPGRSCNRDRTQSGSRTVT
jgi:hypothetical protein